MARWRYSMPDRFGCSTAECTTPEDGSFYFGQFEDGQPNGLGAHRDADNNIIGCGYWENGVLIESLSEEYYDQLMNDLLGQ